MKSVVKIAARAFSDGIKKGLDGQQISRFFIDTSKQSGNSLFFYDEHVKPFTPSRGQTILFALRQEHSHIRNALIEHAMEPRYSLLDVINPYPKTATPLEKQAIDLVNTYWEEKQIKELKMRPILTALAARLVEPPKTVVSNEAVKDHGTVVSSIKENSR